MSQIQDEAYTELCQENERLKFLVKEEQLNIEELSKLLTRILLLLEKSANADQFRGLINEMRTILPELIEGER